MYLKYFYNEELAQASYMIGCQATGEAVVVDPSRNVEPYLSIAESQGFRITGVLETHIHADFVSGTVEMSSRTGAVIYHSTEGPDNGGYNFSSELNTVGVKDQDIISVGNVWMKVLYTPGHTPEHVSYMLTDGANPDKPIGVFTGDFVFVGDVGRPDLLEKAVGIKDSAVEGAKQMFSSLQQFKQLEDYLQIWPGHGAGSACGKALGAVPTSTVGYEKMFNPAFQPEEEKEFIDFLLEGQPEPPAYFAQMKEINKDGASLLAETPIPVKMFLGEAEFHELINNKNNMVVDTRSSALFSSGHIPGTINIPIADSFTEWMGWLTDYSANVYLIIDDSLQNSAVEMLHSIGIDNIKGLFPLDIMQKMKSLREYPTITPKETKELKEKNEVIILDVRFESEWKEDHIPEAEHIMLGDLTEKAESVLPSDKAIAVHCTTGKRSAIAASILLNKGFDVKNVDGGFMKWTQEDLEITSS